MATYDSGSPQVHQEFPSIFTGATLFVCFTDPDSESPSSQGASEGPQSLELRCPHFRNKCGIKRLVQTSKIGFSVFESAMELHFHNVAVQNEYKFKCSVTKCKQRFKTKQQMQNHQGSIHISSSQSGEDADMEQLDLNKSHLADIEESKDVVGEAQHLSLGGLSQSDAPALRQKLKFKCPICQNR